MQRTMTFNIYNWDRKPDHLTRIITVLKNFQPDTVGFQEVTGEWIEKILDPAAEPELCDLYHAVGEDRADSTHERCTILYRRDKFRLIETGTRWMYGDDPLGSAVPGRLAGTDYNRVFTWAVLETKDAARRFAQVNLHPDTHQRDLAPGEEERQVTQIRCALNFCRKLRAEGLPVVLTGDFNATLEAEVGRMVLAEGFLPAEKIAPVLVGSEVEGALYKNTKNRICRGIDHIFLSAEAPVCRTYTVCDQKITVDGTAEYPADHLPRIAEYSLWAERPAE